MSITVYTLPAYIQAADQMIGANHPTLPDTLNAAAIDIWSVLLAGLGDENTFALTWVDDDTVTLSAGHAVTANGKVIVLTEPVTLQVSLNLAPEDLPEAANTLYYVWIETDATATPQFWIDPSPDYPGTADPDDCVRVPGVLRNNASSNLIPFFTRNGWQYWDLTIDVAGSDESEVADASISTTGVDVDCSGWVPQGARLVEVVLAMTTAGQHSVQFKGSSVWSKRVYCVAATPDHYVLAVNSAGLYTVKNSAASVTRISVRGFAL